MSRTELGQSTTFSAQSEKTFAAFESEWKIGRDELLSHFLSQINERERATALIELIRIDMELNSMHGKVRDTQEYLERYPHVAADSESLQVLLFEEYRLRRANGQSITANEVASRYGVEPSDWARRLGDTNVRGASIHRRQNLDAKHFESQLATPIRFGKDGFPEVPSRFPDLKSSEFSAKAPWGAFIWPDKTTLQTVWWLSKSLAK